MSKPGSSTEFRLSFLCPRYWGIWLGLLLLRILSLAPFKSKFAIGKAMGKLLYKVAGSRKQLAQENIRRAFPEKKPAEINQIVYDHFQSLGIGLMETGINLWGKHRQNTAQQRPEFLSVSGEEHLTQYPQNGLLLLVPHFTTLEMTGLMLSFLTSYRPIYRPHDNPLMEYIIARGRTTEGNTLQNQFAVTPIPNHDTKTMIRTLKNKQNLLILPDQRYRSKGSIKVPFFGMEAPSNPGICKLSRLGKAKVLPVFTFRKGYHYHITIHPALENFPSGDDYQDTLRLHQLYEEEIRKHPSQYLWTHNRWDLRKGRDY